MSFEIAFLLILLVCMVVLFLTEKIAVDLTAFSGLSLLILMGYLSPEEAFTGFASSAVITMLSIFIVGTSLLYTGVADAVGEKVSLLVGTREVPLIVTIMIVAAVLSAFMNNIAATAVLMPAVASISRSAKLQPSKLFMPLSFAAILGGTTTLVGTPPNIIAGAMLEERGLKPFDLFDFTPIGLTLLIGGILFMVTVGRKLLVKKESGLSPTQALDLPNLYRLQERLFTLRIPNNSSLDGLTLAEANLGANLGIQVVALTRQETQQLAPDGRTVLRAGDLLLVEGRQEDLKKLLAVRGVGVVKTAANELPRPTRGVTGLRAVISDDAPFLGETLKSLGFRERYGIVVVSIQRGEEHLRERLGDERLAAGDTILAVGKRTAVEGVSRDPSFRKCRMGLSALQSLWGRLYTLRILEGCSFVGSTIAQTRIGELVGITLGGIIREGETWLGVSPEEEVRAGDRFLVAGEPSRIMTLLKMGELVLETEPAESVFESADIGIAEVTISPRSSLAGRNMRDLGFREKYGLQALGFWREGTLVRTKLGSLVLRCGDALLLQGPQQNLDKLSVDPDFVFLSKRAPLPRRKDRAVWALGGLLLMVAFVVTGFQPIQVAAFCGATFVILAGAITMEEAYRAIEWRAIFLVAAVLPVGFAMERTGAAMLMAETVTELAGPFGPYAVLAAMVVLSSLLSQGLDGAPAVVLLTPVVTETAAQLSISPYPMMMGVAVAASAAFMTPFSHKANLLVMGAGGYRSIDYLRVGTPLTVVLLAVIVIMVPIFFPF